MASFDFDLEEMVTYGGREVPIRQALAEYVQAKKQAGASRLSGSYLLSTVWQAASLAQRCADGADHRVDPAEDLSCDDKS